jgi:glycosyltransferase involved in cell wall biosynthesis
VLPPGVRIELIENGVDTAAFTPAGPAADRSAAPLVVQVGRFSRQKGQDRAIRALASCPSRSTRLRLVGDGPDGPQLRALAAELGVADRVEFVGSVDPRPHLRAADVVVLPSRWEGRSLVLLEAMAVGAAVVATGCGDSRDVLGSAGVVLDADEDEAVIAELAQRVGELLSAADERAELRRLARARVEQRYTLRAAMDRYVALWHSR